MTSQITYGNIPLLVPDRAGILHAWLERYFDPDRLAITTDCPTWMMGQRIQSRKTDEQTLTVLPIPNYPLPPPPRLNRLYWPTGATRWASGYFLATGTAKDQILAKLAEPIELTLKIGDTAGLSYVSAAMWCLPPRLLTLEPSIAGYESLWLMPLVDDRYWWQFRHLEELYYDRTLTWTTLIDRTSAAIGKTVNYTTIEAAYLVPDWVQFNRLRDNAGMVLDAIAASTGRRVVRTTSGEIHLQKSAAAATRADANLVAIGQQYAGGEHAEIG